MYAIEINNLSKQLGSKAALSEVSLKLKFGEILGLLGPNGAGKTTLIRILLSILKPDGGSVKVLGGDLEHNRTTILSQVGFASTYTNLPMSLSVAQNLEIHRSLYRIEKSQFTADRDQLLERFSMQETLNKNFSQLSAGQRTRIMLVRALLHRPRLLLLDEPTASLDPDIALTVRDLVRDMRNSECAILLTSHNMEEAADLCDRVIFLNHGRIIAEDTPQHLARSVASVKIVLELIEPLEPIKQHLKQSSLDYAFNENTLTISSSDDHCSALLKSLFKAGVDFKHIKVEHPTLTDYFMNLNPKKNGGQ